MDNEARNISGGLTFRERTPEEKADTAARLDRYWSADTKTINEDTMNNRQLKEAEKNGEKIIEIPVTVTVRIAESSIIDDQGTTHQAANAIYDAGEQITAEFFKQLNEKYPDLIAKAKEKALNSEVIANPR